MQRLPWLVKRLVGAHHHLRVAIYVDFGIRALDQNPTVGKLDPQYTLTVEASFTNAGQFRESSFNPSLGDAFDSCIRTVASKWQLPQSSPAMTFKAQVSLTPS